MNLSTLPNLICVLRILLVVPVAVAILAGDYRLALALFVIAGVSDALDGALARRFGWITPLGQILDPAADKLLVVTTFLALTATGRVPAWLSLAVVGRDALIALGACAYRRVSGSWGAGATPVSKLNTLLGLCFLTGVLLTASLGGEEPSGASLVLGAATLVTTVASGIDYVRTYARLAATAGS